MAKLGTALTCLLVMTLACGCASRRITYLPDGRRGYVVTCGAPLQSWTSCLARAGRLCGAGGYVVGYENEIERELIVSCGVRKP